MSSFSYVGSGLSRDGDSDGEGLFLLGGFVCM